MFFPPWHLAIAYGLDLILGDPSFLPHPVRWIGHFISWTETKLFPQGSAPGLQRAAGFFFWLLVMTGVGSATWLLLLVGSHLHTLLGQALSIWLTYSTLATHSLHRESSRVVKALRDQNLVRARQQLAGIVSRDTIAGLAELKPRLIVYVSCDPATLARDLKELASYGYEIRSLHVIDMFPRTAHVEAVAVIQSNAI